MPYNVLLLPLLGGFLFISYWDRTRWHALRAEKERLLLYAALAGLVFLAVAYVVRSIPPFIPCFNLCLRGGFCWTDTPCPPEWWDRNIGFPHSGLATFAFLLGALSWWPANRIADIVFRNEGGSESHEFVRVVYDHGGPLEQVLLRSMHENKAVIITLKSGKVYVGGLGTSFVPERDKTIHILPSKSGYRDAATYRVVLTTDYDEAFKRIGKEKGRDEATAIISAFGVVLPVEEILAVSLYMPDIHAKYFAHEPVCPHCNNPHSPENLCVPEILGQHKK
jgi:hypothetical protein